MTSPNYENQWWALIYDQMMCQDLQGDLVSHLLLYRGRLEEISGPVLECACGTGLFLLQLLAGGHDMFGFDITVPMLSQLLKKAWDSRISRVAFRSRPSKPSATSVFLKTS